MSDSKRRKTPAARKPRATRKDETKPHIPAIVPDIVAVLDSQKAEDIRVVPLTNHVADAFVIATAAGPRHLQSLCDHLIDKMEEIGRKAHHVEGNRPGAAEPRWMLADFSDVVVHLFTEEGRGFYSLDRLMEDRPRGD